MAPAGSHTEKRDGAWDEGKAGMAREKMWGRGKKGEQSIKKKSRKNMSEKNSTEEGKWLSIRNERDEDERKGS